MGNAHLLAPPTPISFLQSPFSSLTLILFDDIPVWGEPVDDGALGQIRAARQHAFAAAMMADHHLGYGLLIGGEGDESPHCYKRLDEVLEHHAGTVKVLHALTPLGVAMAGSGAFDPYKALPRKDRSGHVERAAGFEHVVHPQNPGPAGLGQDVGRERALKAIAGG